jgi:hypothetical protein
VVVVVVILECEDDACHIIAQVEKEQEGTPSSITQIHTHTLLCTHGKIDGVCNVAVFKFVGITDLVVDMHV